MNYYNFNREKIKHWLISSAHDRRREGEKKKKRKERQKKRRAERKKKKNQNPKQTEKMQGCQKSNTRLPSQEPQCAFPSSPSSIVSVCPHKGRARQSPQPDVVVYGAGLPDRVHDTRSLLSTPIHTLLHLLNLCLILYKQL